VPDATEGDIHKAADIGALGIIVPAVDAVEKAEAAVGLSKDPPLGRGGGDHDRPIGVDYAEKIARVSHSSRTPAKRSSFTRAPK
jgi:2-keto-3-deoxy-L-rhamnonate aldolase RhmA